MIYPDDRILVAVVNNVADWQRVQTEGWYRVPVKHAPQEAPNFDWLAFYFTRVFEADKWAVHYYARIAGHELLTRRDLLPEQPTHKRAGAWYYKFSLAGLQHKLPPIVAGRWRRVSFIVTTGDRFEAARELRDLTRNYSVKGLPFVTLKEQQGGFSHE